MTESHETTAPTPVASVVGTPFELARRSRWRNRVPTILTSVGAGLVFLYASRSAYNQDVTTLFLVYSFLALGMYIPVVLGGHIDLAYNAYFAVGSYSVALVAQDTGWPLGLAIPIAMGVSMMIAVVLGAITARLSGFHLALATLAFGFAAYRWVLTSRGVTGGAAGVGDIPRLEIFGRHVGRLGLIASAIAILWLIATMIERFRSQLVGCALRLQKETLPAAESCGIATRPMQALSLAFGAAVASLAGVLLALVNQFVLAESFTIGIVFVVLFMPILGGMGSAWGAIVGAFAVSVINESEALIRGPGALVFGLVTLLVIIVAPAGLLGVAAAATDRIKRGGSEVRNRG